MKNRVYIVSLCYTILLALGLKGDFANDYNIIKSQLLDKYERPFTVLILGDAQGQFLFSIGKDFPSACVVSIDPDPNNFILSTCNKLQLNNIVFFNKTITIEKLERLSECEHFDVIISLNTQDPCASNETKIFNTFLSMGDYLVMGLASSVDADKIGTFKNYLTSSLKPHAHQLQVDGMHQLFFFKMINHYLVRRDFFYKKRAKKTKYFIASSFKEKCLYKARRDGSIFRSPWIEGINLSTFCGLSGGYPRRRVIVEGVKKLLNVPHRDTMVYNMVVQGSTVKYIDFSRPVSQVDSRAQERIVAIVKTIRKCVNKSTYCEINHKID